MPATRPRQKNSKASDSKSGELLALFSKKLRRRYAITLTLIALLAVLLQILLTNTLGNNEYDTRVLDAMHRQATLSQQITKTAHYIATARNSFKSTQYQEQLSNLLAEFQRKHISLQKEDAALNLKKNNNVQVIERFKEISPYYENIVTASNDMRITDNDANKAAKALQTLQSSEKAYLAEINNIATLYAHDAARRAEWKRRLSYGLMAAMVAVLIIGAYLVSSPAMRRVKESMQKAGSRENDLENLFAASPTALLMIDTQSLRILRGNRQLLELTGLTQNRLEGMSLHHLLDASYETNRTFIDRLQKDKALNEFEVVLMDIRHTTIESLASSRTIQFAGRPVMMLGFTNINQIKKAQRQLEYYATYDELTGLMNRRTGLAFLEKAMARAWRESSDLTVMYADLDGLKKANDRYGHAEGDRLIRAAANIITGLTRMSDCAVRLGGDEFLIILPNCSSQNARRIADNLERLLMALKSEDDEKRVFYSISCGITSYASERHGTPEDLIAEADKKMYRAKQMRK